MSSEAERCKYPGCGGPVLHRCNWCYRRASPAISKEDAKPEHEAAAREVCAENLYLHREGSEPDNNCKLCAAIIAKLAALDDKWRVHWDQAIRERDSARVELAAACSVEYWAWQQDGGNHLESMGETMVIQMTAGNLRAMLDAEVERCAELAAKADRPASRLWWLKLFKRREKR